MLKMMKDNNNTRENRIESGKEAILTTVILQLNHQDFNEKIEQGIK